MGHSAFKVKLKCEIRERNDQKINTYRIVIQLAAGGFGGKLQEHMAGLPPASANH